MSTVQLSAIIITFNEEANIARCIESLRPVADEIIVVDSFSTDQTAKLCNQMKVTFIQTKWLGYSETKNFGNSLAKGDYILSVDADEEVSPELQQSILQFKANPTELAKINRLTNYCGKWIRYGGWYPEFKPRIFKKGLAEWSGIVHENLILAKKLTTTKLNGHLNHYSYPNIKCHILKSLKYSALVAEQDISRGKKYNILIHGLLKPWFKFIKIYFLHFGFLDGYYGFTIAIITSFERFLRFINYIELKRK